MKNPFDNLSFRRGYVICLMITAMLFNSCDKNDDDSGSQDPVSQLPAATMTGENTFGCLINGKPFVVTNSSNQVAFYQGGGLFISGQKDLEGFLNTISITIGESEIGSMIVEGNTYILNSNTNPKGEHYTEILNCIYTTDSNAEGSIQITNFDEVNFIVSGTFHFESVSNDCSGTISITDGRFDLQYIP